ncbi:MAG TPA: ABC transporter permease subunit, partial [Hyphomicrobiales bacterium]|nr:ABC transporter permease subunit [Hyphomicrobiales bacterium]
MEPRSLSPLLSRLAVLAGTAIAVWLIARHAGEVLSHQNIATGFGFLSRPARFQIGESLIPFSPADTYGRAILAGLLNTLQVGVLGCILATFVGIIGGVAKLSGNPILNRLAAAYVEIFRNTPVLLQLFFWYAAIQMLPPVRQSFALFGSVFVSQRGVQIPSVKIDDPYGVTVIALALLLALAIFRRRPWFPAALRHWAILPLIVFGWLTALATGLLSVSADVPRLAGFGYQGGLTITPELLALLLGLVLYTGAFIAEIVRGGIESIPLTQKEACDSLGFSHSQSLRLVILPQAVRIIIPPLASEYLSLVKNSSLAVAIGYPDIFWAVNAIINQTGQAIEGILILAGVYLTLSLLTSLTLNSMNARSRDRAVAAGVRQARSHPDTDTLKRLFARLFGTPFRAC